MSRTESESFWLVIVTYPSGRQIEVECMPDTRREARRVARYFEDERGALSAHVVKAHEWRAAA